MPGRILKIASSATHERRRPLSKRRRREKPNAQRPERLRQGLVNHHANPGKEEVQNDCNSNEANGQQQFETNADRSRQPDADEKTNRDCSSQPESQSDGMDDAASD